MNDLIVASSNGTVTMSSRELASLTEKRHDSVKRTMSTLAESGVISYPQIVDGPKSANGVIEKQYLVGKRDSYVVVAQLSPEFTARLVDRWQELESRQQVTLPSYAETLRLYADQIEETQRVTAERDSAIATKALIGSKREATAMAKASAAVRKVRKLEAELGFNAENATVVAVERATGRKFPRNTYVALRRWCRLNDTQPASVADPRYGFVKAWPAGAWLEHEGIDLKQLFPSEALA